MKEALYLIFAVAMASLGQFTLRVRPEGTSELATLGYIGVSLLFYGSSFLLTSIALPKANGGTAILILSLQYPLLYILFSLKGTGKIDLYSFICIVLGYIAVGFGLAKNSI